MHIYVRIYLPVHWRGELMLDILASVMIDPKEPRKPLNLPNPFILVPATCCCCSTYNLLDYHSQSTTLYMRFVGGC